MQTTTHWHRLYLPLAFAILVAFNSASLFAQPRDEAAKPAEAIDPLKNADFEIGKAGEPPAGWIVPAIPNYRVETSDKQPHAGKQCAVVQRDADAEPRQFGNLMQSIDATPFRGKRVRFRAAVRTDVEGDGNQAQLWFRVDLVAADGTRSVGAFDNMQDRPIKSSDWKHYEIVGDVPGDAQRIAVGMLLLGKGKAWLDDASFEIVGPEIAATAKPIVRPAAARPATAVRKPEPGLFEILGSTRLTPHEPFLRANREEYEKDGRWKDLSMTVLVPLPLSYRDQVPLSYEISVHPSQAADTVQIFEDKPHNYVAKLVLADVLNRKQIDVKFRSTVLVGPSSFDDVPDTAAVPAAWPDEAQPWLTATWCADAQHERIQAMAKEIRADTDDVLQIISRVERRAKEIFGGVEGHVRVLTAVEALDKRGSCTSCGNLVAALLRAADVPARVLSGYPSWSGPLQTHYIVEAYVPGYGWYPIESTRCESPWPNFQQINVAIIPVEHEEERLAKARRWAAGGVPYLSLTESPDNPGYVLFRGMLRDGRNCDHVCEPLRSIEAQPADWKTAIEWAKPRWSEWVMSTHKLNDEGRLSFGKPADKTNAATLAELMTELK